MDSLGGHLRSKGRSTLSSQIDHLLGAVSNRAYRLAKRGSKFIKKNWRTRSGKSLLLETRGKMLGHYSQKKRRQSRSRSRGRSMSRGRSKPKSAPLKVRASSARTGKSVMKARSGKFRRTRSQRGNKRLKIAKQIRSAQIYLQNPFVYRYQGESIQYILPNQRTVYQGRMYNWHSHPDGGGVGARWRSFAF